MGMVTVEQTDAQTLVNTIEEVLSKQNGKYPWSRLRGSQHEWSIF